VALNAFSPAIEDAAAEAAAITAISEGSQAGAPDVAEGCAMAYLDARGIAPRYGDEADWGRMVLAEARRHIGVDARLGVAGSKYAAWVAALTAEFQTGYRIVDPPDRAFLAPLPISTLRPVSASAPGPGTTASRIAPLGTTAVDSPPSCPVALYPTLPLAREAQRRLLLLGLRTVGQFAALRETSVAEQFGPESLIAHRWARGLDDRPVLGRRCQMVKARHEFEVPETRREALVETAMRLTVRAMRDLPPPQEAWAIKRLQLEARFDDGTVQRHLTWLGGAPGAHLARALWGNLVERLSPATAGVAEIGVRLVGLEPTGGKQLDLFVHTRTRLQLEQTLGLLAKKHSPACVVRVDALDAREPLMARRYGFYEYRP